MFLQNIGYDICALFIGIAVKGIKKNHSSSYLCHTVLFFDFSRIYFSFVTFVLNRRTNSGSEMIRNAFCNWRVNIKIQIKGPLRTEARN